MNKGRSQNGREPKKIFCPVSTCLGPISNLGFVGIEAALFEQVTNPILSSSQRKPFERLECYSSQRIEVVLKEVVLNRTHET